MSSTTRQLLCELRRMADAEESKARRHPNTSTYCLGVRWGLILAARELEQAADREESWFAEPGQARSAKEQGR